MAGIVKLADLSAVVAPSVTMPCTTEIGSSMGEQSLPPLHNVASIPSGPFEVIVPVAATYPERIAGAIDGEHGPRG